MVKRLEMNVTVHTILPTETDDKNFDRHSYEIICEKLVKAAHALNQITAKPPLEISIWYEFEDGRIHCRLHSGANAHTLAAIAEAIED